MLGEGRRSQYLFSPVVNRLPRFSDTSRQLRWIEFENRSLINLFPLGESVTGRTAAEVSHKRNPFCEVLSGVKSLINRGPACQYGSALTLG